MIKDNQTYFNRLHVILDAMITAISYIAAWYIRIVLFAEPGKGVLPMETYFTALYFIVPGYLLLYWMANLYRSKRFSSPWKEAVDVIRANIFGLVLFFVVLYIVNEPNFSRSMIFVFFGINIFIMLLVRKILRVALRSIRKRGYNIKHILLVGYSRATEAYIDRLLANPEWGYMVCGILDDKIPAGTLYRDIKVLGGIGNLQYILQENKMDEIGITLSLADYDKLEPIMLVSAIAIKAGDGGEVIFKQTRVGLHNKEFEMYKFRTMRKQTEEDEAKGWTKKDDERVTKFGKFLRRTSLDEVPQFFNILKGDMSLVGPRPERPQWVEKFKEEIPRYMIKHQVRPGLTGWAQVNGYRGDTSIYKRIEYDIYYIENWSFTFDIKIMFLTIFKGFINKNAY